MVNVSSSRRHVSRLLLASILFVLSYSYASDVVLNPGILVGKVGLDGWNFTGSIVFLSDNASGYSASTSFEGTSFTLTAEGDQAYGRLELGHTFPGGSFKLSSFTPYLIPANDRLEVDLRRPGGTLLSRIHLTSGTLVRSWHKASASDTLLKEQYEASAYAAGEAQLPMVAGGAIELEGSATVSVPDEGGAELCTITVPLRSQKVSLERGATVTVVHELNVSAELCRGATLSGTVALDGLQAGISFSYATVNIPHPTNRAFRVTPSAPEYRFSGLPAGQYPLSVFTYFEPAVGAKTPRGSLLLPPSSVEVGKEGEIIHDFRYQGILVDGVFVTDGYAAAKLQANDVHFASIHDLPGGGSFTRGSASFRFENPMSRSFHAVLTSGKWQSPLATFKFEDAMNSIGLQYITRPGSTLLVPESGSLSIPQVTIKNSNAFIVFDVKEMNAGDPEKLISSPRISAYRDHPVDKDWAYVDSIRKVKDKAKPSVMIIGPRGTYTFDAYAAIDGASVRFATSSVELGTLSPTAVGSGVAVALQDGGGGALPISLQFETVEQGGDTSASLTNTGPEPAEGYELLDFVGGAKFLGLHTTAMFEGEVALTVTYDPVTLGLDPSQESKLELQQFVCREEGQDESCEWVRISSPSLQTKSLGCGSSGIANPDTARHAITGYTSALGIMALALPKEPAQPPLVSCVGTPEAPVRLEVAPGTCGLGVDAASRLAGGCTAGSAVLDSCTLNGQASLTLSPGLYPITLTASALDGQTASCTSYLAVVDVERPQVYCPPPQVLECSGENTVAALQASCSDNCEGCTAACRGGPFMLGTHTIICSATDTSGHDSRCETSVTVADSISPRVRITSTPAILWPPNHEMHPISLQVDAVDMCDPHPDISCSVESNEPDDSRGDGHTRDDIEWRDGQLWLRAERSATGTGRVYTLTCTAKDASGNQGTGVTRVTVPQSMGSSGRRGK